MSRAFIALGSNLQQPQQQVTQAFAEIAALPHTTLLNTSSLYRSAPVGYDNQPDFINAVAEVDTGLPPDVLLQHLLAIETEHGRERPFPNAPRPLDLDLLIYDTLSIATPELTIPHPRMHTRGFVLLPLEEIAPDLEIPNPNLNERSVAKLAKACMDQGVTRI